MNRKILFLFLAVIGLTLVAAVAYYIMSFSKGKEAQTTAEPVLEGAPIAKSPVEDLTPKTESSQETQKAISAEIAAKPLGQTDIERLARSFAERFGSFSNQSNYSNITDLEMFMSEKMKQWAEDYVKKNSKENPGSLVYYGLTTKAVSVTTKNFDDAKGTASILVSTRRREAMGMTNNTSKLFNQDITINFVKERGAWKVDSANWNNQ
jgi:hypothetical protein